jgi:UDP-N-acetylmuramoyl-tripeptide--D-alanyl-D-alanine ligase
MTRHVLEGAFRVHASRGNLNNLYGCPLSLVELSAQHQACVLEMGMSTHGELTRLAEIADPDIGILTNVSGAHLANFTSLEDYADAKAELFAGMRDNTTGIFNNDDEQCRRILGQFRGYAVTCGMDRPSDLTASDYRLDGLEGARFEVRHARNGSSRRVLVRTRFAGRHHVYNALMAIAAGYMLGMDLEAAAARLADLNPLGMRGRVLRLKSGVRVLDDSYNSNPGAMRFALQLLREATPAPGGRRLLVFGDMLELGAVEIDAHRDLGAAIGAAGVELAVGVGRLAGVALAALEEQRHGGVARHHFETSEEASAWVARAAHPGDLILVKGSRGVALEKVVAALRERFGEE